MIGVLTNESKRTLLSVVTVSDESEIPRSRSMSDETGVVSDVIGSGNILFGTG